MPFFVVAPAQAGTFFWKLDSGLRWNDRYRASGALQEQALRIASGNGTDAPVPGSTHTITTLPSAYTQA